MNHTTNPSTRPSTLKTVAYWLTTGLVALDFAFGGVYQIIRPPQVVEGMAHLGYPGYFVVMLGVWKILGALAIVAPRLPLIKEWAYAGIGFDVIAAAVSLLAVGDGIGPAMLPIIFAALAVASYLLRPASRRLATVTPAASAAAPREPSFATASSAL